MKHVALLLSVLVSIFAIVLLLPVAIGSQPTAVRVAFGTMALAYGIILAGSILVAVKKAGKSIARLVSAACACVPIVWLVGCLDAGMVSSMEVMSALAISCTVVFQWFVYQAYRLKSEA
jgi:hypothetical protein